MTWSPQKGHFNYGGLYVFICFRLVSYVWWSHKSSWLNMARQVSVMKFKRWDIELVVVLKMQAWSIVSVGNGWKWQTFHIILFGIFWKLSVVFFGWGFCVCLICEFQAFKMTRLEFFESCWAGKSLQDTTAALENLGSYSFPFYDESDQQRSYFKHLHHRIKIVSSRGASIPTVAWMTIYDMTI